MENYFAPMMDRLQVNQISALGLAHCGDAVFELLVRSWLCCAGGVKADSAGQKYRVVDVDTAGKMLTFVL